MTGLPLLAPVLDHCHDSDMVRGMINDLENLRLGQWAGDSYVKAKNNLAKLKDKDGIKGKFLVQAMKYFLVTPAMQAGLSWRVTGKNASLPESRDPKNLKIIRATNALSLRRAQATMPLRAVA